MGILLAEFFITKYLGQIMNLIYEGLYAIGIENVIFSIILFTIIVYTLLLPFTIKQQKFTRISSVMNPEIQAIQKKYKGKTDQASMLKQQDEMKMIYAKYGTSPTGGCLVSLIQLPVLFALWPVISNVEKYVGRLSSAGKGAYNFLAGYAVSDNPGKIFNDSMKGSFNIVLLLLAISIPVLAGLSQWISMKTSQSMSKQNDNKKSDNDMANQMNGMMKIMPIFSVVMCFSMPIGLGIYWIVSAVVRIIQQVIINIVLDKKTVKVLVEENVKKQEKKNANKKAADPKQVNSMAQKYTKKMEEMKAQVYEEAEKKEKENKEKYSNYDIKPGSLASRANMVSEYNKRNNK